MKNATMMTELWTSWAGGRDDGPGLERSWPTNMPIALADAYYAGRGVSSTAPSLSRDISAVPAWW